MFAEATEGDGVGYIDQNPFRKLSGRSPSGAKNWRQVSPADLVRIMDACPGNGWRALFALARLAGLRRGEALHLQWGDIDWAGNRFSVNARITKTTTKKKQRTVPIEPARCPSGLTAFLRQWFEEAGEGETAVCAGVDVNNIDRLARGIIHRSGVGDYRKPFHALRKNRATELAAQYPQHVLSEWMGHDAAVAEEYYLRVDEQLYEAPPDLAQNLAQITPPAPTTKA